MVFELAGVPLSLEGLSGEGEERLNAFSSERVEGAFPVFFSPLSEHLPHPEVVRKESPGRVEFLYRDFALAVEQGAARAQVRPSAYAEENVLRVLLSYLLAQRNGFLIHAAGLLCHHKGYLFYGKSGAGKSTWAAANRHLPLLSDELVAVRRCQGGYLAYSTPFWGSFQRCPRALSAPLSKAFHLEGRGRVKVSPLRASQALFTLLPCLIAYGQVADISSMEKALDFVQEVPCYAFSFEKNKTTIESIKEEHVVTV